MSGGPNPRAAREGAAGWRAGTELCVLLACFAGQRQAAKIRRQLDKRIGQSRDAVLDQVVVKINAKRRAQVHDPRRSLGGILTPALTWGIFGLLAGGLQSLAVYAMLGAVSGSPGVPSRVSVAASTGGGSATWPVDQSLRSCARHHRGYLPVTPGTLASGRACIGCLPFLSPDV